MNKRPHSNRLSRCNGLATGAGFEPAEHSLSGFQDRRHKPTLPSCRTCAAYRSCTRPVSLYCICCAACRDGRNWPSHLEGEMYGDSISIGAGDRTRTCDRLITNQLHYQLCYSGTNRQECRFRKIKINFCLYLVLKRLITKRITVELARVGLQSIIYSSENYRV